LKAGSISTSKLSFTPTDGSNVIATINASSEGINIDADNINISGTTAFTSGYDPTDSIGTHTAQKTDATHQRIVVDGGTGTIKFYDDTNTLVMTIDDDITGSTPGIHFPTGGYIKFGDSASDVWTGINAGAMTLHTDSGPSFLWALHESTTISLAYSQLRYTYDNGKEGMVIGIEESGVGNKFTLDSEGNIETIGNFSTTGNMACDDIDLDGSITMDAFETVDGYDVSAMGSKLTGIASGATVGATWSSNITNQPASFTPSAHAMSVHNGGSNGDYVIHSAGGWATQNFASAVNALIAAWIVANGGTDTNFVTGNGETATVTDGLIKSYT